MTSGSPYRSYRTVPILFFVISFLTLTIGILSFLITPADRISEYYLSTLDGYQNRLDNKNLSQNSEKYLLKESLDLAVLATKNTPYNAKVWRQLSLTYAQLNEMNKSMRANEVANQLGLSSAPLPQWKQFEYSEEFVTLSQHMGVDVTVR